MTLLPVALAVVSGIESRLAIWADCRGRPKRLNGSWKKLAGASLPNGFLYHLNQLNWIERFDQSSGSTDRAAFVLSFIARFGGQHQNRNFLVVLCFLKVAIRDRPSMFGMF